MVDWKKLSTFRERLEYVFEHGSADRAFLADCLDRRSGKESGQATITNWLAREKIGAPSARIFRLITGASPDWVNYGDGEPFPFPVPDGQYNFGDIEDKELADVIASIQDRHRVAAQARQPISNGEPDRDHDSHPSLRRVRVTGVAVVDAQGLIQEIKDDPDGNGYFMVEVDDEHAHLVRLRGPGSTFVTKPGWYVLLAPYADPEPDEDVVLRLESGLFMAGKFVKLDGGEYQIRRPDNSLAVLAVRDVDWIHPIHGTMSPKQIRRDP